MTTNGFDFSRYTTVTDIQAVLDEPTRPSAFAYICGWTGYRDDHKFNEHRRTLVGSHTQWGGTMWGAFGEVGYGEGSQSGQAQAANFWSLITNGGIEWNLPPWVALEDFPATPRIDLKTYLRVKAMPWIHYLADKMGELPMVYTGPNFMKYYLHGAVGQPEFSDLFKCPLAIARYNTIPIVPQIATPLKSPGYDLTDMWSEWAMWQYYGDYNEQEGISDIDLVLWPGDRASLEAWAKDRTAGIPVVEPPKTEQWVRVVAGDKTLRMRQGAGLNGAIMGYAAHDATFPVQALKIADGYTWALTPGEWVAVGEGLATLEDRAIRSLK